MQFISLIGQRRMRIGKVVDCQLLHNSFSCKVNVQNDDKTDLESSKGACGLRLARADSISATLHKPLMKSQRR